MKITRSQLKQIIKEEIAQATVKELIDTVTDFEKIGLEFGKTIRTIDQKLFDVGFVAGKQNFGLMSLIKMISTKCARLGFDFSDGLRRRLNQGYKEGAQIFREMHPTGKVEESNAIGSGAVATNTAPVGFRPPAKN